MDFSYNTSLAYKSSISFTAALWNQEIVRSDVTNFLLRNEFSKPWSHIENDVFSNLAKINMPKQIQQHLRNFIQPMGMQIVYWVTSTSPLFAAYDLHSVAINFVWSQKGTFDYIKTALQIIDANLSNKILCFCLASMFCIEDVIIDLLGVLRMSQTELDGMSDFNSAGIDYFSTYYYHRLLNIENFEDKSILEIKSEASNSCPFLNYHEKIAFQHAVKTNDVTAASYFLKKIEPGARRSEILIEMLELCIKRKWDANIVILLFPYLEENLTYILSKNAYKILSCLLDWPHQQFFMSVANRSWDFISNPDYLNLFQDILEKVSRFYECHVYRDLIKEFWQATPHAFKTYVIHKCISGTFLSRLFIPRNTDDIVQMIFEDCSPEERQQIIFYFEGMNLCDVLVKRESWDSLKLLICSCIPSKNVLEEFIRQYQNYKPSYFTKESDLRKDILIQTVRQWY